MLNIYVNYVEKDAFVENWIKLIRYFSSFFRTLCKYASETHISVHVLVSYCCMYVTLLFPFPLMFKRSLRSYGVDFVYVVYVHSLFNKKRLDISDTCK